MTSQVASASAAARSSNCAAFGLLAEWFRVCVRHGRVRIPDHGRKNRSANFRRQGRRWLDRVNYSRSRRGVASRYGPYAERAGVASLSLTGTRNRCHSRRRSVLTVMRLRGSEPRLRA